MAPSVMIGEGGGFRWLELIPLIIITCTSQPACLLCLELMSIMISGVCMYKVFTSLENVSQKKNKAASFISSLIIEKAYDCNLYLHTNNVKLCLYKPLHVQFLPYDL